MAAPSQHARRRAPRPLDPASLEQIALHYVGRYATTRSRLRAYLGRKLAERGWMHEQPPSPEALVERLAALGYVDDAAFAEARASALLRRGFGRRRISQALSAAGIAAEESPELDDQAELAAALRFAQRKRLGPYSIEKPDRISREKALAAMLRAGHSFENARKILDARPRDVGDQEEN